MGTVPHQRNPEPDGKSRLSGRGRHLKTTVKPTHKDAVIGDLPDPGPMGSTAGREVRFPSRNVDRFRRLHYPHLPPAVWNDWKWQIGHRITTMEQISRFISITAEEQEALSGELGLPFAVTPYYLSLLHPEDPAQPLRRTVVPTSREWVTGFGEEEDPLDEEGCSPVPGLIHRYPDRVLLLVTGRCSTYCRYCTRSRMVTDGHAAVGEDTWNAAISYIEANTDIRDVLISGGDPLILPDGKLQWLLARLHRIEHVQIMRIGTKVPVVLPQRITPQLVSMLKKYHPLYMSIHFTHPDEITPECAAACARLADAGIPLGSQTVLLKGINDSVPVMTDLVHRLMAARVRPYYLYQCDPIHGSAHFRTSVHKGLEIIRGLRGHTTGYAVPTYVIDAPGGGGKIPIMPDYVLGHEEGYLKLRNYEGKVFSYPAIL